MKYASLEDIKGKGTHGARTSILLSSRKKNKGCRTPKVL